MKNKTEVAKSPSLDLMQEPGEMAQDPAVTEALVQRIMAELESLRRDNRSDMLRLSDAVQAGVREMIQTRTELQGTVVDVQELRTEMHSVRERLSSVRIDAAFVAGGVAALVFVINLAKDWFHR